MPKKPALSASRRTMETVDKWRNGNVVGNSAKQPPIITIFLKKKEDVLTSLVYIYRQNTANKLAKMLDKSRVKLFFCFNYDFVVVIF